MLVLLKTFSASIFKLFLLIQILYAPTKKSFVPM
nr:MAG TPA: hypothetical protein [Caudoviricetes sp.]